MRRNSIDASNLSPLAPHLVPLKIYVSAYFHSPPPTAQSNTMFILLSHSVLPAHTSAIHCERWTIEENALDAPLRYTDSGIHRLVGRLQLLPGSYNVCYLV